MWTHKIKIVRKKIQCPESIFHGGASLLKFSGRNAIAQFLTKINFIHYAYFGVVMDQSVSDDLFFGMIPLLIISLKPIFEISSKLQRVQNRVLNVYMCTSKSKYRLKIYNKQSSRAKQQVIAQT